MKVQFSSSGTSQLLKSFIALCGLFLFGAMVFAQGNSRNTLSANEHISTGLLFVDPERYQSIPLATAPLLGTLPASADLSTNFPQPGDQGQQASCVGWAVAYALKSYQEKVERKWPLTTDAHLFSPAFIYNQIKTSNDCNGGTSYVEALNLVRLEGVASLQDFPYDSGTCSKVPGSDIKQRARPYAIAEWRRVNVQDETEVKTQIAAGFPVLAGIVVDHGFFHLRGSVPYSQFSGENLGGHAIVLVGYDDSRSAFKLINSWGLGWGNAGYGWITYAAFKQVAREGYVAQDIVVNPVSPAPNPVNPVNPVNPIIPVINPNPIPSPVVPAQPVVLASQPVIQFNVPVQSSIGQQLGMVMRVNGSVTNGVGKHLQIVARFSFQNGLPLRANPSELVFRDVTGLVATGTSEIEIRINPVDLTPFYFSIPYYALNLAPTGGHMTYALTTSASVYLDHFLVYQTPATPLTIVW